MIGLFGGRFDPPHAGHLALAREAVRHFALERLHVLVVARPAHKGVVAPAEARLELASAAFAGFAEVELDPHPTTVELLETGRWSDPLFLIGSDQLAVFDTWREPERVLELARLGVAARPGYDPPPIARPDRILFFRIEPVPVSSTEVRERVARGEPIDGLVPPEVVAAISALALYHGA